MAINVSRPGGNIADGVIKVHASDIFQSKLARLKATFREELIQAMDSAMREIAELAKMEIDWNPEGIIKTERGHYIVTGASKASIEGGAQQLTSMYNGQEVSGGVFGELSTYTNQVVGVLTMYTPYSMYLQAYEMRGPGQYSPNLFGGGRTITTEAIYRHQDIIMTRLQEKAAQITY